MEATHYDSDLSRLDIHELEAAYALFNTIFKRLKDNDGVSEVSLPRLKVLTSCLMAIVGNFQPEGMARIQNEVSEAYRQRMVSELKTSGVSSMDIHQRVAENFVELRQNPDLN